MLHRHTLYIGLLLVVAVAMAAGFGLGYAYSRPADRIDDDTASEDGNSPFTLVPVMLPLNKFAGEVWAAETVDVATAKAVLERPIELEEGKYSFVTLTKAIAHASDIDIMWNPRLVADDPRSHDAGAFRVHADRSLPADEGSELARVPSHTTVGNSLRIMASLATEMGVPIEAVQRMSPGVRLADLGNENRSVNVVTVVVTNNALVLIRMSIVAN